MKWDKLLLGGVIVLVLLSGCNLPAETVPAEVPVELPTLPPPTEEPAPPPPTPEAPPVEAEIVHIVSPAMGHGKAQVIHDQPSKGVAPEKRAYGGDEYPLGRYERPFTTEDMEYLPYIDIVQTVLFRDDDEWVYTGILVAESPALAGDRRLVYGIELDNDLDGRGDVLVVTDVPSGQDWSTQGVQVWQDVNEDVGGAHPMKPDAPASGDGYEVLVFDAGKGEDPDLAWARRSPDQKELIEIAFKLDLVDVGAEEVAFLWGAWAFAEQVHPDWFDHHDLFTLAEAGSSLIDNPEYPLKAFYAADNTCRALSGTSPGGVLPGLCPTGPKPGGDSTASCPPIECPSYNVGSTTIHTCLNPETCECEPCE
ncbi:MAG: hypothetical protein K8R77_15150 [Anaerolineaceae bacterium]|nr:hypothetical protein [Anaerolineaceae bacterium]